MFDLPGVVDAKLVGEFDLVERVVEELLLSAVGPGLRKLVLVKDTELHLAPHLNLATTDEIVLVRRSGRGEPGPEGSYETVTMGVVGLT